MNYGTAINGIITAPLTMRSNFNGVGAWHTLTDEERAEHGWYPADVINEGYEPRRQERTGPFLSFDGERIKVEYKLNDKSLETIKSESLDQLANIRYQREVAGVTSSDGVYQPTSRAERFLLADKIAFMERNPGIKSAAWKSAGKWHRMSLDNLKELQSLAGFHVEQAFVAESAVAESLMTAESIDDLVAIDMQAQFDKAFSGEKTPE